MRSNQKRWVLNEADPIAERRLHEELGIGPVTARILAVRGLEEAAAAKRFFQPRLADLIHPDQMCGAKRAAESIADAVEKGYSIAVHGDYDVDGITATALLTEFLQFIGHPVEPYIPDRIDQGYGLAPESVREMAQRGHKMLITVDCGANDHESVKLANEIGLQVIITDHHEIAEEIPPALAVLNPHQANCGFHDEKLAGVGVSFFLTAAVRAELIRRGNKRAEEFDMKNSLDLVTLGTVADIVPLVGINRILVYHGLPAMDKDLRPGIAALKGVSRVKSPVRCGDISFRLAPRINAAGRLGNANVSVELMLTQDAANARRIAAQLNEENLRRQEIEAKIFQQAQSMFERIERNDRLRTIVLAHPDWHPGVIGIVASRMVEKYHRPTILLSLTEDSARGSGRSISAFNLFLALQSCATHLEGFGGHSQAAGVQIKKENIMPFAKAFDAYARAELTPEDMISTQRIDAWCDIDEISDKLVRELSMLAPFGFGNPEPVLGARDIRVLSKSVVGNDHLKLRIAWRNMALAVMAYGRASLFEEIGSRIDLAYSPEFNNYGGVQHIQLRAKDIKVPDA